MGSTLQRIPEGKGPYSVGCTDLMTGLDIQGSFLRVYYPSQSGTSCEDTVWIPKREYYWGLSDFLKLGRTLGQWVFGCYFESPGKESKGAKDHVSEDEEQKEKIVKITNVSEDKAQKEKAMKKTNVSEDKAQKEKPVKTTNCNMVSSKSKRYCTVPQTTTTCDCQLCDDRTFEPMDVNFIVYHAGALPRQDSDAMEVTESYEELVDNESAWRKADGQTLESHIQEMRAYVPKTKPLSQNESDDVIIEEFIPDDPQLQPASGPSAISGPGCPQHSPNVGFIMTDLTKSDMDIFSLWNEEVMRRAVEQQKQGQSRQAADAPLQMVVAAKQPMDCQGCNGASAGKPPETFVLQVISFDSPSVTVSENEVLNCGAGQQAGIQTPTNYSAGPANTCPQMQTGPSAAVSVTSLSYGVFKVPQ